MSGKKGRKPKFPPVVPTISEEEIVQSVNQKGVSSTAKDFGISRITLWRWLNSNNYVSQYVKQQEQAS